jgi:hypothetical protein
MLPIGTVINKFLKKTILAPLNEMGKILELKDVGLGYLASELFILHEIVAVF